MLLFFLDNNVVKKVFFLSLLVTGHVSKTGSGASAVVYKDVDLTWVAIMLKCFIFCCLTKACRFCTKVDCYLDLSMMSSFSTRARVSAEERQPHSTMLPSSHFTMVMILFGWFLVLSFFAKNIFQNYAQKLPLSDHNTFWLMTLPKLRGLCVWRLLADKVSLFKKFVFLFFVSFGQKSCYW